MCKDMYCGYCLRHVPRAGNERADKGLIEWEIPGVVRVSLMRDPQKDKNRYVVHAKVKTVRDKFWHSPWITHKAEHSNVYGAIEKATVFIRKYGFIIDPESILLDEILDLREHEITMEALKEGRKNPEYVKVDKNRKITSR